MNKYTWIANSRVGSSMSPLIPTIELCSLSRLIKGNTKAAVFPEPVLEQAITSFPARINGIV